VKQGAFNGKALKFSAGGEIMKFWKSVVFVLFLILVCSPAVCSDEVDMFCSGGQDHRISCAYDPGKDLTAIRIERFVGTKLGGSWESQAKGKVIVFISSDFFSSGDDAIILAVWNDEGALNYEIFQFSNGLLHLKWARENIPEGILIPGGKVIGEKRGCQGKGIFWNKSHRRVETGPLPIRPYHQSGLGVIVEFKISDQGKVAISEPGVKQGVRLKKSSQMLVLVQNDESPVIGKISFQGNICWMEGEIPGSYRFPFASEGEVCITPIGFEKEEEKFPLVVE